jgi:hypothetical protein
MKTNVIRTTIVGIVLLVAEHGYSQGTFVNLNFENPIPPLNPDADFSVPIANALPGWVGYIGTNQTDRVVYNTISLGEAAISLQSATSSHQPIEGNYSVILQGQFNPLNLPSLTSAGIAQTGQIPVGSQSLRFYSGSEYVQATFAGQNIPLVQLDITGSYLTLGGDISGIAGQTGELKFTLPSGAFSYNIPYVDNIQFSNQLIPEPSVFGLFGLGALVLGWRLQAKPRL